MTNNPQPLLARQTFCNDPSCSWTAKHVQGAIGCMHGPARPTPLPSDAVVETIRRELERQKVPFAPLGDGSSPDVVGIYNSPALDLEALAAALTTAAPQAGVVEALTEALLRIKRLPPETLWDVPDRYSGDRPECKALDYAEVHEIIADALNLQTNEATPNEA